MEQSKLAYRKTSNIRGTLLGNKIVDHSDVVGASPAATAPNYISILDLISGFNGFGKVSCKTVWESLKCWDLVQHILKTWQ